MLVSFSDSFTSHLFPWWGSKVATIIKNNNATEKDKTEEVEQGFWFFFSFFTAEQVPLPHKLIFSPALGFIFRWRSKSWEIELWSLMLIKVSFHQRNENCSLFKSYMCNEKQCANSHWSPLREGLYQKSLLWRYEAILRKKESSVWVFPPHWSGGY